MSTTRTDLGGTDSGQGVDRDESPPGPRTDGSGQPSPGPPSLKEVGLFLDLPFLVTSLWTFAFTADDPFITLRYAANLVRGNGLVFNPGQYIQGFTSPLDIVVAVLSYVIPGGDDLFKLKIASLVFGLLALREASLLVYGLTIPRWSKRVACVAMGNQLDPLIRFRECPRDDLGGVAPDGTGPAAGSCRTHHIPGFIHSVCVRSRPDPDRLARTAGLYGGAGSGA